MYTQVAYALAVTSGTEAVSQAVSVAGANVVGIDMTIINQDSGNLDVVLEGAMNLPIGRRSKITPDVRG